MPGVFTQKQSMIAKVLVKAGILSLEVFNKPIMYSLLESIIQTRKRTLLAIVHDVAKVVKQAFVVFLVFGVLIVLVGPHDLFLKREVGRNPSVNFGKFFDNRLDAGVFLHSLEKPVQAFDHSAVFMID